MCIGKTWLEGVSAFDTSLYPERLVSCPLGGKIIGGTKINSITVVPFNLVTINMWIMLIVENPRGLFIRPEAFK